MSTKIRLTLALALAALAAAVPGAAAAARTREHALVKGDLLVIFRGSGAGSYRYREPAGPAGGACRSAEQTYSETDSYSWDDRFQLAPGGGTSTTPFALLGSGQLSATDQLGQCAGAPAQSSTCSESLAPPSQQNAADLAYPGVVVAIAGNIVTVGALGELVTGTPQPACAGAIQLNPVAGFPELQALVSFPRSLLGSGGDVVRHFTMAGSGLYDGVALAGGCDSSTCDVRRCTASDPPGGPPSSCSYQESYSGTIEVRTIR